MWGLTIACLRAWEKTLFSKEKLIRFNTTEDNTLGKDFTIFVGFLSSVDVLVVEAVSSFFKSLRDNRVKAQSCLFVNGRISGHSAAWIDAIISPNFEIINYLKSVARVSLFSHFVSFCSSLPSRALNNAYIWRVNFPCKKLLINNALFSGKLSN